MKEFAIHPVIWWADSIADFCHSYAIDEHDLVFASARTQRQFIQGFSGARVIDYRRFGVGEPTDEMVEGILRELGNAEFRRVFAIGGGTILDVAKLFALQKLSPVTGLFAGQFAPQKVRQLILVPTTCGTGSEVTNISILSFVAQKTKLGLAAQALFADEAVLVPELLQGLPARVFGASSIDALIHAVESYTSPKANSFTQEFSLQAMDLILHGYQAIAQQGDAARQALLPDFLRASTLAGIAFGNAGCAAVHAMSYPLGAACHVPHGESNYVLFTAVYRAYQQIEYGGCLQKLYQHLAALFECPEMEVLNRLEELLGHILRWKKMHEYGTAESDIERYADTVMNCQGRLMANNYTKLDRAAVISIYRQVY